MTKTKPKTLNPSKKIYYRASANGGVIIGYAKSETKTHYMVLQHPVLHELTVDIPKCLVVPEDEGRLLCLEQDVKRLNAQVDSQNDTIRSMSYDIRRLEKFAHKHLLFGFELSYVARWD